MTEPTPIPSSPDPAGQSRSPGDSAAGRSGGDTIVGRYVVERGLATSDEVDKCRELLKRLPPGSRLSDILIQKEVITRRQFARVQRELESERPQQAIPGYQMMKKLGAGAMATVFLAKQLSLDRLVAIKILPRKYSSDPKFIERFYKEGRAAAKLNDQHIVGALDVGQAGDNHYFVMEYVDGETVHDRILRKRRIEEKEAIEIIIQVAKALKHAHLQGFIHRDIKPKNMMINKAEVVKLADLGLARAISDREAAESEAGKAFGTPYYISPEQARGVVTIGPAADIYGLGATFYHMVTGKVPFEGKNPTEVMQRQIRDPLVPPDHVVPELTTGVALIIEMMMAKDPRDRYQSAAQLLEDLESARNGHDPIHARPTHSLVSSLATNTAEGEAPPTEVRQLSGPSSGLSWKILLLGGLLVASLMINLALLLLRK
ncbi:MAG: serine/threonine protein kinase [Planctomycetes bacterium]|nr:serine/threonine protein kinase [Planctomycetota bacterium]